MPDLSGYANVTLAQSLLMSSSHSLDVVTSSFELFIDSAGELLSYDSQPLISDEHREAVQELRSEFSSATDVVYEFNSDVDADRDDLTEIKLNILRSSGDESTSVNELEISNDWRGFALLDDVVNDVARARSAFSELSDDMLHGVSKENRTELVLKIESATQLLSNAHLSAKIAAEMLSSYRELIR